MARKGARSRAEIPPDILIALNDGSLESATLAEGLAIDQAVLIRAVAPGLEPSAAAALLEAGIVRRMALAAELLLAHAGHDILSSLTGHSSDTVRGWAAYVIAQIPGHSLPHRLAQLQPLADDPHFGVREWAWLALRPHLVTDIEASIQLLQPWAVGESANLRRFASEVTRPRGVWCAHIAALRQNPALGLPILEPLRADPSPYVQDSVANWLNDAAKDHPAWVRALCARWRKAGKSSATARICQRALRSL